MDSSIVEAALARSYSVLGCSPGCCGGAEKATPGAGCDPAAERVRARACARRSSSTIRNRPFLWTLQQADPWGLGVVAGGKSPDSHGGAPHSTPGGGGRVREWERHRERERRLLRQSQMHR